MRYLTFFLGRAKSSKSSMNFTLKAHFQCSISTYGLWLLYWTAQIWPLPMFLTLKTYTIFSFNKINSAFVAFFFF